MMRCVGLSRSAVAAMRLLALAIVEAAEAEFSCRLTRLRTADREVGALCEIARVVIRAFACPRYFAPADWGLQSHVDGLNRRPAHAGHEDYG